MSIHHPHFHLPIHAIVELGHDIAEKAEKGIHRVKLGNNGFKLVSGVAAFRHYDWLRNLPRFNTSGNFRGMVLSKNWKTAFLVSSKVGQGIEEIEPLAGKLNLLASAALNIVHAAPEFERVAASGDGAAIKAGKFGALTASVASKTLLGVVEGPSHLLLHGLAKTCSVTGMLFHNPNLNQLGSSIDHFDVSATNIEDGFTNPKNIFKFFNPSLSW